MQTLTEQLHLLASSLAREDREADVELIRATIDQLKNQEPVECRSLMHGEVSAATYGSEITAYENVALVEFISEPDMRRAIIACRPLRLLKTREFIVRRQQLEEGGTGQ